MNIYDDSKNYERPGIDWGNHIDDWIDITSVIDNDYEKQYSPITGLYRYRQPFELGAWIEGKPNE